MNPFFMISSAGASGDGGAHAAGISSTIAETLSGWRIASGTAESAPAEAATTAVLFIPRASRRHACASACAIGVAFSGRGVRR